MPCVQPLLSQSASSSESKTSEIIKGNADSDAKQVIEASSVESTSSNSEHNTHAHAKSGRQQNTTFDVMSIPTHESLTDPACYVNKRPDDAMINQMLSMPSLQPEQLLQIDELTSVQPK